MLIVRKDSLWKGIIDKLFKEFLEYFYPKFVEEVDFNQPYELLDKELQEIIPASETSDRRADLLVKVFLKNGTEKWLLVHIEVQGYVDKLFDLRMFTYYYRTFDRFDKRITALAIFTDDNPSYHPKFYEEKTWNTRICYEFDTFKVMDFDEDYFLQSKNPFASVLLTARKHLNNKSIQTDEELLELKLDLFRTMFEQGHAKTVIREVAHFIKHYVSFKKEEFLVKFEQGFDNVTKYEKPMGIVEYINRDTMNYYLEKGMEKGLEKGIEEGLEKGIEEGIEKGRQYEIFKQHLNVKNMLTENLQYELIAKFLEMPIEEIKKVETIIWLKKQFRKGQTIDDIAELLKTEKDDKATELTTEEIQYFYKEVAIENALKQEENIKNIEEELNVTKDLINKIKEGYGL